MAELVGQGFGTLFDDSKIQHVDGVLGDAETLTPTGICASIA